MTEGEVGSVRDLGSLVVPVAGAEPAWMAALHALVLLGHPSPLRRRPHHRRMGEVALDPGEGQTRRPRGQLRIYLGAAAGVGKTYALLSEGHRRAERGADVVVAFAETHGRPQTAALIDGLEVIP